MSPDDELKARAEEPVSPFASMPSYKGGNVIHLFVCQECQAASRYTQSYTLPTVIFMFVWAVFWSDTYWKCPRCIRRHIVLRLPLAIVLANLASPYVVFMWLWAFGKSFFCRTG
jgi:hypothetical protein